MAPKWISWVVVLQLGCATAPASRRVEPISDLLPSVFRGVQWSTTPEQLAALFPGSEIFRSEWTCDDGSKCLTFGTTVAGWAGFGNALLQLHGPRGGPSWAVDLTAVDPRPQCSPTETARPFDCLVAPHPALDAKWEDMRRVVEPELGPGTVVPGYSSGVAHGYPADPLEHALIWNRQGYKLILSVGADEFSWSAELSAYR